MLSSVMLSYLKIVAGLTLPGSMELNVALLSVGNPAAPPWLRYYTAEWVGRYWELFTSHEIALVAPASPRHVEEPSAGPPWNIPFVVAVDQFTREGKRINPDVSCNWGEANEEVVATKDSPEVVSWTTTRTSTWQPGASGPVWEMYLVTAEVYIQEVFSPDLPRYCFWPRRIPSTGLMAYGDEDLTVAVAELGVTDVEMFLSDPESGKVTLRARTYRQPDGSGGWIWKIHPDDIEFHYSYARDIQVTGAERQVGTEPPIKIPFSSSPLAIGSKIEVLLASRTQGETMRIDVIDASGRVVARPMVGTGLRTHLIWGDGETKDLPSGVYWMRVTSGEEQRTVRLVTAK